MSDLAIEVCRLGKRYYIPEHQACYRTLRDTLTEAAVAPLRRLHAVLRGRRPHASRSTSEVWALRDISFEVRRGEVLGIIGHNGSGKSTLLKILSRITMPTEGHGRVMGRVGSLLEVGTGFHFELSGRENVFLNGAMLGMTRAEIERKFDEIVEFSQIGRFLDTPVKHYSSGMYMRLAFSVAAHLESEILLVDEVLAVGDQDFQKKCMHKIREVTESGRTVLFVSHSMGSIETLCDRAVLLSGGRVLAIGPTADVINQYVPKDQSQEDGGQVTWEQSPEPPGNEYVTLQSVSVHNAQGEITPEPEIEEDLTIRLVYQNHKPGTPYVIRILLKDQDGSLVLSAQNGHSTSIDHDPWFNRPYPSGQFESLCHIPGNLLNDHQYSVSVIISPFGDAIDGAVLRRDDVLSFKVVDSKAVGIEQAAFLGPIRPRLAWQTQLKEAA